ncbi:hypothetical protein A2U01_0101925, partial [Trifolium medium]|nr:hypothetical protein [Trifolium medium]
MDKSQPSVNSMNSDMRRAQKELRGAQEAGPKRVPQVLILRGVQGVLRGAQRPDPKT